jgi:glycosyltransferase involved in cell wall biosynthesis
VSARARIDQVIPSIIEHDAVSNHTFEAQRLLRELGFESEIYARILGPGVEGRVRPIGQLPEYASSDRWLLYQSSIGSPVADAFAADPGRKLLDYHNITPAELVERWIPPLGEESRLGREQLVDLAPLVPYAIADSEFNAAELRNFGFARAEVVSVLIESANLAMVADSASLDRLDLAKSDGGSDWLFVGQVAPHKAQHDLVAALACYRKAYEDRARLHLVGRPMGSAYLDSVSRFADSLGLATAVELPGSVPAPELCAYYESADVFVCLSHHEGFCVPIVEAMARGLAVVAADVAAVPGTLGDAGVLLKRRDPAYVASAVHELLEDRATRASLVRRGLERAKLFSLDAARESFRRAITEAVSDSYA